MIISYKLCRLYENVCVFFEAFLRKYKISLRFENVSSKIIRYASPKWKRTTSFRRAKKRWNFVPQIITYVKTLSMSHTVCDITLRKTPV